MEKFCPDLGALPTLSQPIHDKITATVVINGTETAPFTFRTGVKQGYVIAPTLFTVYLVCAMPFLVRGRLPRRIETDYRLDGRLFNLSRLKAKIKVTTTAVVFSMLMTVSFLPTHRWASAKPRPPYKSISKCRTFSQHKKDHLPTRSRQHWRTRH